MNEASRRYAYLDDDTDPTIVLAKIVEACEAPDADLKWIAILFIDRLLDEHWEEIGAQFEDAMRSTPRLRIAFSFVMADIPDAAIDRLDSLMRPEEFVGRKPPTRS
jgi:hypothetical protein